MQPCAGARAGGARCLRRRPRRARAAVRPAERSPRRNHERSSRPPTHLPHAESRARKRRDTSPHTDGEPTRFNGRRNDYGGPMPSGPMLGYAGEAVRRLPLYVIDGWAVSRRSAESQSRRRFLGHPSGEKVPRDRRSLNRCHRCHRCGGHRRVDRGDVRRPSRWPTPGPEAVAGRLPKPSRRTRDSSSTPPPTITSPCSAFFTEPAQRPSTPSAQQTTPRRATRHRPRNDGDTNAGRDRTPYRAVRKAHVDSATMLAQSERPILRV